LQLILEQRDQQVGCFIRSWRLGALAAIVAAQSRATTAADGRNTAVFSSPLSFGAAVGSGTPTGAAHSPAGCCPPPTAAGFFNREGEFVRRVSQAIMSAMTIQRELKEIA